MSDRGGEGAGHLKTNKQLYYNPEPKPRDLDSHALFISLHAAELAFQVVTAEQQGSRSAVRAVVRIIG